MKRRFNSKPFKPNSCILVAAGLLVLFFATTSGWCDPVALDRARLVAENTLRQHLSLCGTWEGSTAPTLSDAETISYRNGKVAYNFPVLPSGHVLVAVDDLMTPLLLYSTSAAFHGERATNPRAVESWIVPELHHRIERLPRNGSDVTIRSASSNKDRITRTWDDFTRPIAPLSPTRSAAAADTSALAAIPIAMVGPLLTTRWHQETPYSLSTPDNGCPDGHTLTGCVATAWAQLMNYWQWPDIGAGSNSYQWNNQTLEVDFQTTYGWDLMPDQLTDASSSEEKSAVATLVYHTAIAANSDFDCYDTASSAWANDVLDVFFRYKKMTFYDRSKDPNSQPYSADAWFNLIKSELDAVPPRPVIFSIFTDSYAGHEVVIDGYKDYLDNTTDMVHINFGWDGSYDGYYAIASDFVAGNTNPVWTASTQYIVTGIEPNDNGLPTVTIDSACDGMTVVEGTTGVTLSGLVQPAGSPIVETSWRCANGPVVFITDSDQLEATFSAPQVSQDTDLLFHLKAVDALGSVGFDQCTITVRNTVPAIGPSAPDRGGGGGGGCFIAGLF